LLSERRISEQWVKKLLGRRNSGFNIHNQGQNPKPGQAGAGKLGPVYPPFSVEKITYQQQSKTVVYRSKMNPVLKKNFAVFPVLDWIATLTTHIPNKGEQLIRHYGYYNNVSRGKRKKEKPEDKTEISEIDAPPVSKELEKRWSYFIRKVYETDPLTCPKCQGEMWFDKLTTLTRSINSGSW
jgi:putative transposase